MIDVEVWTGLIQVSFTCKEIECSATLALCCKCNGNDYICVIRQVTGYFGLREVLAHDVCPLCTGNKLTFHLLEVAYSFNKMMEHVEDKALRAVNLDKIVHKHKQAIDKVEKKAMPTVEYDENDELNAVDFSKFISVHM